MRMLKHLMMMILLLSLAGTTAVAQDDATDAVWTSVTIEQMATLMQEWGYRAEIKTGEAERAWISSATGGVGFTVQFFDPVDDGFSDIQMISWFGDSFEGTVEDANSWNVSQRHVIAIHDSSDNTTGLQLDLTLTDGVTESYIKTYFRMWEGYLEVFQGFLTEAH